jgi:hypothetical protein
MAVLAVGRQLLAACLATSSGDAPLRQLQPSLGSGTVALG